MKNMINYYYGLKIKNIVYASEKYYIETFEHEKYVLKKIVRLCDDYFYMILAELKKYKFFSQLILNKNGELITKMENSNYILLKESIQDNLISIYDLKNKYYLNVFSYKKSWVKLWEQKIDEFEMLICEKNEKYNCFMPIFNYYIGLSENAVLFFKKNCSIELIDSYVASHERLSVNSSVCEYYDPTNVIFDYSVRDIAEYIKSMMINNCFDLSLIENYLNDVNYNFNEINMLFARVLFPTYFFDAVEFFEKGGETELKKIEQNLERCQDYLKRINEMLSQKYGIEQVNWL